jgi:hypothetical protein
LSGSVTSLVNNSECSNKNPMVMANHSFHQTVRRVSSSFLLGVVCILAFTVTSSSREVGQSPQQPSTVKFSHRFHVRDAGVGCADCHTAAPTSKLASDTLLAKHEQCQSCHDEQLNSKCVFCHTSECIDPISCLPKHGQGVA